LLNLNIVDSGRLKRENVSESQFVEDKIAGYELRATSYELRATGYGLRASSQELGALLQQWGIIHVGAALAAKL